MKKKKNGRNFKNFSAFRVSPKIIHYVRISQPINYLFVIFFRVNNKFFDDVNFNWISFGASQHIDFPHPTPRPRYIPKPTSVHRAWIKIWGKWPTKLGWNDPRANWPRAKWPTGKTTHGRNDPLPSQMVPSRSASFQPILGVGRFGLGRWVISALGHLGPESFRPNFNMVGYINMDL